MPPATVALESTTDGILNGLFPVLVWRVWYFFPSHMFGPLNANQILYDSLVFSLSDSSSRRDDGSATATRLWPSEPHSSGSVAAPPQRPKSAKVC